MCISQKSSRYVVNMTTNKWCIRCCQQTLCHSGISMLGNDSLSSSLSLNHSLFHYRCWNENNKYYHCMDCIGTAINLFNRNHPSEYCRLKSQIYEHVQYIYNQQKREKEKRETKDQKMRTNKCLTHVNFGRYKIKWKIN